MPDERREGTKKGVGRPKGSKNKLLKEQRKLHQLRAHDEEWTLINDFAKFIKHGEKSLVKGGDFVMTETRPCTKEDIKSMLADQVILADDCKRQLKRMEERPLMDDNQYRPFFEKALKSHKLMIEFFTNYLKRFE